MGDVMGNSLVPITYYIKRIRAKLKISFNPSIQDSSFWKFIQLQKVIPPKMNRYTRSVERPVFLKRKAFGEKIKGGFLDV